MEQQTCRVCGCTDDRACTYFMVMGDGSTQQFACSWIKPGLCSECGPRSEFLIEGPERERKPEPLLYDAGGVPLVFR